VPTQVLYVGVAQEKQRVFRTSKRRNPVTYPWLVPGSGVVNQYYFYCVDEDFGPVWVKFSGYFPYTGRLILNGNEYAKRQAARAGIGFVPLDNAFAAVDDVAAVQAICDGLDLGRPDRVSLIFGPQDRPQGQARHAGPVPHPRHHRGRHPVPARGLSIRK